MILMAGGSRGWPAGDDFEWGMLMDKPLQVTFHNLEHSDAVEDDVRARMAKLNEIYERITNRRGS